MKINSNIITNNKFIFIYLVFILLFVLFSFNNENYTYFKNELVLVSILTVVSCILIYYSFKKKLDLHKIAFLIVLIFGVLLVVLAPPMGFPDEGTHFTRAELITEGQLYPEATEKGYYVNDYFRVYFKALSFSKRPSRSYLSLSAKPSLLHPICRRAFPSPLSTLHGHPLLATQ